MEEIVRLSKKDRDSIKALPHGERRAARTALRVKRGLKPLPTREEKVAAKKEKRKAEREANKKAKK